jgi:hypothetical protein
MPESLEVRYVEKAKGRTTRNARARERRSVITGGSCFLCTTVTAAASTPAVSGVGASTASGPGAATSGLGRQPASIDLDIFNSGLKAWDDSRDGHMFEIAEVFRKEFLEDFVYLCDCFVAREKLNSYSAELE